MPKWLVVPPSGFCGNRRALLVGEMRLVRPRQLEVELAVRAAVRVAERVEDAEVICGRVVRMARLPEGFAAVLRHRLPEEQLPLFRWQTETCGPNK